jgi:hypothetical protein
VVSPMHPAGQPPGDGRDKADGGAIAPGVQPVPSASSASGASSDDAVVPGDQPGGAGEPIKHGTEPQAPAEVPSPGGTSGHDVMEALSSSPFWPINMGTPFNMGNTSDSSFNASPLKLPGPAV